MDEFGAEGVVSHRRGVSVFSFFYSSSDIKRRADGISCIEFVINVRNTRNVSISEAYALATEEFVSLRGRHQLATLAAEIEARHYGAEFKPDVFVRCRGTNTEGVGKLTMGLGTRIQP